MQPSSKSELPLQPEAASLPGLGVQLAALSSKQTLHADPAAELARRQQLDLEDELSMAEIYGTQPASSEGSLQGDSHQARTASEQAPQPPSPRSSSGQLPDLAATMSAQTEAAEAVQRPSLPSRSPSPFLQQQPAQPAQQPLSRLRQAGRAQSAQSRGQQREALPAAVPEQSSNPTLPAVAQVAGKVAQPSSQVCGLDLLSCSRAAWRAQCIRVLCRSLHSNWSQEPYQCQQLC